MSWHYLRVVARIGGPFQHHDIRLGPSSLRHSDFQKPPIKSKIGRGGGFLLRQVKCRSVSELQSVTGINNQLIMAEILHDERRTILNTRGPYFSVIRKMAAGFSIDRPLTTRTLLLSGLTMLKVMTPQGHALVCLDAQRETDLEAVNHRGIEGKPNHLVCENINRPRSHISKPSSNVPQVKWPLTKSPLR